VNQWTLLVGTLPLVFAIASESVHGLPVEPRQREEILLTAAQSVFAVATLSSLSMSTREALALFGLFWAQFILGAIVPESWHGTELVVVSILYLIFAAGILLRGHQSIPKLLRDGFRTPHAAMND
jgi:cation:H+ antiporter